MASYGSRAENWPAEEQHAAKALLASSVECRTLLEAHRPLDNLLDTYNPKGSSVSASDVLTRLKSPWLDSIISWLMPLSRQDIWKPALVTILPLCIGILVGSSNILNGTLLYPTQSATNWDEEIYMLALSEETSAGVFSSEGTNE